MLPMTDIREVAKSAGVTSLAWLRPDGPLTEDADRQLLLFQVNSGQYEREDAD
jgi:hypothetical protein